MRSRERGRAGAVVACGGHDIQWERGGSGCGGQGGRQGREGLRVEAGVDGTGGEQRGKVVAGCSRIWESKEAHLKIVNGRNDDL